MATSCDSPHLIFVCFGIHYNPKMRFPKGPLKLSIKLTTKVHSFCQLQAKDKQG